MTNPVFAADNHSYDRNAIETWFRNHNTSPKTGAVLDDTSLRDNVTLRTAIDEWRQQRFRLIRACDLEVETSAIATVYVS